jgi:K+-transporting ATPase ATPase A chain
MIQVVIVYWLTIFVTVAVLARVLSGLIKLISVDWNTNPPRALGKMFEFLKRLGLDTSVRKSFTEYAKDLLFFNTLLIVVDTVLLAKQSLFFNGPDLPWDLAFNTAVSFATNTNLQHYAGELALTNMAQSVVIGTTMFIAPASGIAVSFAFLRALKGVPAGNYYRDLVMIIGLLLLPLSLVSALILAALGVPQSFREWVLVENPYTGSFTIRLGPIASFEAIKLLGSNGGGFFGSNSAHPFENPSGLTSFIESVLMLLIPTSLLFTYGEIVGKKRGLSLFAIAYLTAFIIILISILDGLPPLANLIEPRLGYSATLVFNTASILSNTGATASSLLGMKPSAVTSLLLSMFMQAIPGADGVGLLYLLTYLFIVVFIGSLMVGKTPRFINIPISVRIVKLSTVVFLLHPALILIPTSIALLLREYTSFSSVLNPQVYTMVLYEFTSAAANNGSSYLGPLGNTFFWNVSTAIVMLLGRYLPIILFLVIAEDIYKAKRSMVEEPVETQGALFVVFSIVMILILTALTFFPFLVIGPMMMGG